MCRSIALPPPPGVAHRCCACACCVRRAGEAQHGAEEQVSKPARGPSNRHTATMRLPEYFVPLFDLDGDPGGRRFPVLISNSTTCSRAKQSAPRSGQKAMVLNTQTHTHILAQEQTNTTAQCGRIQPTCYSPPSLRVYQNFFSNENSRKSRTPPACSLQTGPPSPNCCYSKTFGNIWKSDRTSNPNC